MPRASGSGWITHSILEVTGTRDTHNMRVILDETTPEEAFKMELAALCDVMKGETRNLELLTQFRTRLHPAVQNQPVRKLAVRNQVLEQRYRPSTNPDDGTTLLIAAIRERDVPALRILLSYVDAEAVATGDVPAPVIDAHGVLWPLHHIAKDNAADKADRIVNIAKMLLEYLNGGDKLKDALLQADLADVLYPMEWAVKVGLEEVALLLLQAHQQVDQASLGGLLKARRLAAVKADAKRRGFDEFLSTLQRLYPEQQTWIFVCHAGPDKPVAKDLRRALNQDGLNLFVDQEDIPMGVGGDDVMERAIIISQAAIVLLSEDLFVRKAPMEEVRKLVQAHEQTRLRFLLPVFLRLTYEEADTCVSRLGPMDQRVFKYLQRQAGVRHKGEFEQGASFQPQTSQTLQRLVADAVRSWKL
ncbi:hypothetical protein WJX72_007309 [[Myrmecia] bisecta]|uniref:TIR domain-containing protein n=1 Tax=[Myrmecia] bisecta TaxID=41462 RepID=A0AAW1QS27_9CHLO